MRKVIRRTRRKLDPPVPGSLDDLVITDEWAETLGDDTERFLFYDNGTDALSRVILFGSESALRKLAASSTWFMDGNFAMAPPGFLQMYVIRVPLGTTAVTTVYALVQNKSQDTYDEMFRAIMNYCEVVGLFPDPLTVLCDFELADIRSVNDVLGGDVNIQACFYHFTQATWRKIQELGLVQRYRADDDFKMFCAKLDGLAFLPIDDVTAGFELLRANTPEGAEPLVQYFAQTYVIGRFRRAEANIADGGVRVRMQRIPPRYQPAVWNVHDATLNDEPRTNNQCEGFNNRFIHVIGYHHPTIWAFIRAIKQEDCRVRTAIEQDLRGNPPTTRIRKAYVALQKRLKTICQDRSEGRKTIAETLQGIAFNIRWRPFNMEHQEGPAN